MFTHDTISWNILKIFVALISKIHVIRFIYVLVPAMILHMLQTQEMNKKMARIMNGKVEWM
jgi:hypothetical protein